MAESTARRLVKRALLGPVFYPQNTIIGLEDPQREVTVTLEGLGESLDVTHQHLLACCAPLTIGIALGLRAAEIGDRRRLTLRLERVAGRVPLGELELRPAGLAGAGAMGVSLFRVTGYRNRMLSPLRLWAHHASYRKTYQDSPEVPITLREVRAMIVYYLCPRPVNLVTVDEAGGGNLFPMNLMGRLGGEWVGFALNSHRASAALVREAGRVVLSSIPVEMAAVGTTLGGNHRRESIDWEALPFTTVRPQGMHGRVPEFALRARALQVEAAHVLGSHTLFLARVTAEERLRSGPEWFSVQGFYRRAVELAEASQRGGGAAQLLAGKG